MVISTDLDSSTSEPGNTLKHKAIFVLVPPKPYRLEMPNYGDRALHEGMRKLLKASFGQELIYDEWNSFPRMTLSRLNARSIDPSEQLAQWHIQLQQANENTAPLQQWLSKLLFGPAFSWLPGWGLLDRMSLKRTGLMGRDAVAPRLFPGLSARTFESRLAASDAVVMNAGGLIADHLSHYLPGRIFALLAAQLAGKPVALVNYSFAVTRPDLLEWVAPVLRGIDLHAVRESQSRNSLLSIGVKPEKILVVPDAAFAVDQPSSPSSPSHKKDQLTIALQVRGDRRPDIEAWAKLIGELRTRLNARVVFLVGCCKHDPPVLTRLQKAATLDVAARIGSLSDLKKAIGSADILISDRYHGAVFATQMGTPFIPLSGTTHKTAGLIADLDYAVKVHPPLTSQGIAEIMHTVTSMLADHPGESEHLRSKAKSFQSRLFDDYRSIFHRLLSKAETKTVTLE